MNSLQKVAVFFFIIGFEKGRSIIPLMDSDEINNVVPEISKLTELSPEVQKCVWDEFKQLGYKDEMNPSETLSVIRLLFNGSKISNTSRKRFF
jgi:flagellar motor switch protein FliG